MDKEQFAAFIKMHQDLLNKMAELSGTHHAASQSNATDIF